MIDNLLDAFRNLLALACVLVALRWIVRGFPQRRPWPGRRVSLVVASFGLLSTALLGWSLIRDRELFLGVIQGLALAVEAIVMGGLWGYWKGSKSVDDGSWVPRFRFTLVLGLAAFYRVPGFLLAGSKALGSSQLSLSTDTLVATFSLAAELVVVALALLAVSKVSAPNRQRALWGLAFGLLTLTMVDQVLSVLQILGARGVFARVPWMMKTLIVTVNLRDPVLLLAMGLLVLVPFRRLFRPRNAPSAEVSRPQRRRLLALKKREDRWAALAIVTVVGAGLFVGFGQSFAEAPVIISQAEPVVAKTGRIELPLAQVDDGLLHRYVYTTEAGVGVRFIIVKKGGASYGVGLDACNVCGPTGYFQRQGQVICRLCDVQMNKATIGFPGGCNPVPLEYSIDSGRMVFQETALVAEAKRFK